MPGFFACFAALAKKPASDWAGDAREFVKKEGLTVGDKDTGSFRPKSFITRQEVAAVLKNEREKDETVRGPGFPNGCRGFFVPSLTTYLSSNPVKTCRFEKKKA